MDDHITAGLLTEQRQTGRPSASSSPSTTLVTWPALERPRVVHGASPARPHSHPSPHRLRHPFGGRPSRHPRPDPRTSDALQAARRAPLRGAQWAPALRQSSRVLLRSAPAQACSHRAMRPRAPSAARNSWFRPPPQARQVRATQSDRHREPVTPALVLVLLRPEG